MISLDRWSWPAAWSLRRFVSPQAAVAEAVQEAAEPRAQVVPVAELQEAARRDRQAAREWVQTRAPQVARALAARALELAARTA